MDLRGSRTRGRAPHELAHYYILIIIIIIIITTIIIIIIISSSSIIIIIIIIILIIIGRAPHELGHVHLLRDVVEGLEDDLTDEIEPPNPNPNRIVFTCVLYVILYYV